MSSRIMVIAALAVIVPILLVLLIGLALVRPTPTVPPATTSAAQPTPTAPPAPTKATQPAPDATAAPVVQNVASGGGKGQATAPSNPPAAPRPSGPAAPELIGGGAWINSDPLTLAGLQQQGNVVLVDFWTYGCYNCANTLPYLKQWWGKYKDQGL